VLPHDAAGDGPAVVLLHAGVLDRTEWADLLAPLAAAGRRAVAFDLPGFGEAAVVSGEQAQWVDVVAAMDELGIERAVLVGNSFGGAVAMRVAAVTPERVAGLVLVSVPPPDLEPSPELEAVWEAEESALDRGDRAAAVEVVVGAWTLPDAPPALREQVAAAQRRAFELQDGVEVTEAPDPLEEDPELVADIAAPTLVVAGGRDMVDFREGSDRLARQMPNARLATIEEAGHLAPLETPEAFRDLLLEFLEELG
jgi:3-oxoadipate enol-lactonase